MKFFLENFQNQNLISVFLTLKTWGLKERQQLDVKHQDVIVFTVSLDASK